LGNASALVASFEDVELAGASLPDSVFH
jgi:hypothetical protein